MKSIQAVCTDQRSIVSGSVQNITDWGCEIMSTGSESTAPIFPRKTNIVLNLLNEATGETLNMNARLTGVTRKEGTWAYRVRWAGVPEFIK